MARTEHHHHDGSLLSEMSRMSAGVAAVGLSSSPGSGVTVAASSSTIEEAPATSRVTHRSPEECIQQATKESCTEICREREEPASKEIDLRVILTLAKLVTSCSCSIGRSC